MKFSAPSRGWFFPFKGSPLHSHPIGHWEPVSASNNLKTQCYYCLHFINEGTKSQRKKSSNLAKLTKLVSDRIGN